MSSNASVKSLFYAFSANLSIALIKAVAAFITGSGSMLAESIHSFADTANQGLLFKGMKEAERPPDELHPLGYGKSIYFWSFIVALMLFSIGGLFSIYEGWHKLHNPGEVEAPWLAVGVLAVSIIIEGLALRGALIESRPYRRNKSLIRWIIETRRSALMVVIAEDLAAVLGLLFALSAILMGIFTGNPVFDAIGSIGIGVLLMTVAIFISTEIHSLMIGESAAPVKEEQIRRFLMERKEIVEIYNLITIQLGDKLMLAAKVKMVGASSPGELIDDINRIEKMLHSRFPTLQWIFFEPDNMD